MLKAYRIILMFALSTKYCHITLMSEIFRKEIPRGVRASLERKFASHLKHIGELRLGGLAKLSLSTCIHLNGQKALAFCTARTPFHANHFSDKEEIQ